MKMLTNALLALLGAVGAAAPAAAHAARWTMTGTFDSPMTDAPEDRTRELKTLIGQLTIDNECLKALLRRHEERDPLAFRRSKPGHAERAASVNRAFGVRRTMRLLGRSRSSVYRCRALARDGLATVFAAIDHATAECVGIHATKHANRFEALEPIRQGVRAAYGSCAAHSVSGLIVRDDHGSQYVSRHFQPELTFLSMESSPFLRPLAERQRLHRAFLQDSQGTAPVGPQLRRRQRRPPRRDRVDPALRRTLADRTPRPPPTRGRPQGAPCARDVGLTTLTPRSGETGAVHRALTMVLPLCLHRLTNVPT